MHINNFTQTNSTPIHPSAAGAHGAIKAYFLVLIRIRLVHAYRQYYSIRTHVHAVPLNPYNCTGGMTPSVQMYTV
jgi:hypothetical protein